LTRQEAREVIVQSAGAVGIEVEADMVDELLHDLDNEAFPDAIAPAELQLVCSELAEGVMRGQKLTLQRYRDKGEAERILQTHFDRLLEQQLPDDQELALWLLEVLLDRPRHTASEKELKSELAAYGFDQEEVTRVLGVLESSGITSRRDPGAHYDLVSGSLAPRIRQWATGRATRHAREEAIRQVRYIQGSAFRGLFGGALGLGLAFLLTAILQSTTPGTLALRTLLRMMPGALCGMVLVLMVDVVLASYRRMRPWARWLTCGLAGAVSFGLALAFHDLIRSAAGAPSRLLLVALEGALWGAVCGAGMLWVMTTRRPVWQPLAVVSLACGVVLALAETFGGAFSTPVPQVGAPNIPAPPMLVALAGAVMPLFTIGAALFGHRPSFMRD
jgi:hypothetical protein